MTDSNSLSIGKQLVSLIKYYCFNGDYPEITNYKEVCKKAVSNSVINLFYLSIKNDENCPENVKQFAFKKYNANVRLLELQKYYAEEIFKRLDEKGVSYLTLKGDNIRKTYPSEDMRISCDLDFYYDESKQDLLDETLGELGFVKGARGSNHVIYENSIVTVEAHFDLYSRLKTAGGKKFDEYFDNYFSKNTAESGAGYKFNDFESYVQFTMHNVKHLKAGGFGIRTILDYAYLNKYNKSVLDSIIERANEFGIKDFITAINDLVDYWFYNGKETETVLNLEKYVLNSGTYGSNANNAQYGVAQGGDKNIKARYYFRKIFPTYETMSQYYSVLKKAPILLPLYYVIRWFEVVFKRPGNVKKVAETANNLKKEEIKLVEDLIKQLNIK